MSSSDYPTRPLPLSTIRLTDAFWSRRVKLNHEVTIPYLFKQCEKTGRIENFLKAAKRSPGYFQGNAFDDSDVFKTIEAASYMLSIQRDASQEELIDQIIENVAAGMEEDGYLYTPITAGDPHTAPQRWKDLMWSHELYNVGTLYEAAAEYQRATQKTNLTDLALKNAELVQRTFGPADGQLHEPDGHEEIEVGLVKLFRLTGNRDYLHLAAYFIDLRGTGVTGKPGALEYSQDHAPVVDQQEAAGHAVRAAYLYMGMADLSALASRHDYLRALLRIWDNMVSKKMYLTGGIGSRIEGEAFGDNYELPNDIAYNETCAAIASVHWSQRMFQLTLDARYIDVLERTLYNAVIAGISLEGNRFFYPNPLETDGVRPFNMGSPERVAWFDCPCCPSSFIRFMPQLPGFFYAVEGTSLYVNLYGSNEATVNLPGIGTVGVSQATDYPWDGKIRLTLDLEQAARFTLHIRIPGWSTGRPVPSDLYRYREESHTAPRLLVNGCQEDIRIEKGYAKIDRLWTSQDTVEICLDMPIRRVVANEAVDADRGKVAIERGPIVYCFETVDNGPLDFTLPDTADLRAEHAPDLLGGVVVIKGDALLADKKHQVTAVPYYAWNNRGAGAMKVWIES